MFHLLFVCFLCLLCGCVVYIEWVLVHLREPESSLTGE